MTDEPKKQEERERPEIVPGQKADVPLNKRVAQVGDRLKKAWEVAMEKGTSLSDKLFKIIAVLFSEYNGLTVEQEEIDQQEQAEVAAFLEEADNQQIADAAMGDLDVDKLDEEEKKVVDNFYALGVQSFKDELDDGEEKKVGTVIKMLTDEDASNDRPVQPDERNQVAYFGLKTLKVLKADFEKRGLSVDQIAKELEMFAEATGKDPAVLMEKMFKFNDMEVTLLLTTAGASINLLGYPLTKFEDKDWSDEDRKAILEQFGNVLPATAKDPEKLEEVVDIMHEGAVGDSAMTSVKIAKLISYIAVADVDKLAKLIYK